MKNNTVRFKKSANSCAWTFSLLSAFLGFVFATTVATVLWQITRGEFEMNTLPRYLGGIVEFLFTALSFLVMAIALFRIARAGAPFSQRNIKTFKISGTLMTIGGMIGSLITIIMTKYLPDAEPVDMEGLGVGLIFCGVVIVMFVDFLSYGSGVQDELDSIA